MSVNLLVVVGTENLNSFRIILFRAFSNILIKKIANFYDCSRSIRCRIAKR